MFNTLAVSQSSGKLPGFNSWVNRVKTGAISSQQYVAGMLSGLHDQLDESRVDSH